MRFRQPSPGRWAQGLFLAASLTFGAVAPASAQSPRASYQQALAHMQEGDWAGAIQLLEGVVAALPGNARLHNTLGIALSSAGRADEAARQFQAALALEPAYPSALKNMALHEMARERPAAAKPYFERLIQTGSRDPVAHLGLAEIAYAAGDFAKAVPHFEEGRDLLGQDPRLLANFGEALLRTGRPGKAALALERVDSKAPPEIHFRTGMLFAKLGRYASAAREFELAAGGADPYDRGFNLTLAYVKAGRHAEALQVGQALVKEGHRKAELYNLLAQAHAGAGDVKSAYDALRTATDIDPREASNYIDLIALCLDHENFDLGLEIADISVRRVPASHRLHLQRGVALAMKGRFEDAQEAFRTAAGLAPERNLPGVALGLILMQQDRLPDAVRVLREQAERHPEDYLVQWFLAEALHRSGVRPGAAGEAEAVAALRASVGLHPELFESHLLLGKMLARRGELDEAIEHLERARELDPDDVSATYQLALVYRRQGQADRARELLALVGERKADDRDQFARGGLLRIVREGSP